MPQSPPLPADLQALVDSIPALLPMRRGAVSERFMRCGKPACACHRDEDARHGPYYSWTRVIDGTTRSRLLSPAQAEIVRRQVAAGGEFRRTIEQFWEAAERMADQEVERPADPPAEKGGSATNSRRRSRPKSSR